MELHLQVKQARERAGLTKKGLAELAGVDRKDVYRFENGQNITMTTFLKIVNSLPGLRELSLGSVALRKDAPATDADLADLRKRAMAVLDGRKADDHEAGATRETSLLRILGQLLVDLTGGDRR